MQKTLDFLKKLFHNKNKRVQKTVVFLCKKEHLWQKITQLTGSVNKNHSEYLDVFGKIHEFVRRIW